GRRVVRVVAQRLLLVGVVLLEVVLLLAQGFLLLLERYLLVLGRRLVLPEGLLLVLHVGGPLVQGFLLPGQGGAFLVQVTLGGVDPVVQIVLRGLLQVPQDRLLSSQFVLARREVLVLGQLRAFPVEFVLAPLERLEVLARVVRRLSQGVPLALQ